VALLKKQKEQISACRAAATAPRPFALNQPGAAFVVMVRPVDTFVQHSWTFLNDGYF